MQLKVLEAYTRDVARGVARIDYDSMDKLEIKTGDTIKLYNAKSNKFTVAKALPLYPSDEHKVMIRIDGLIRKNLLIEIASEIDIEKIEIKNALSITALALEDIPPIDERYLADALENVPVVINDKVMVPYFGGRLPFQIQEIEPEDMGVITQKTLFKIVEAKDGVKYSKIGKAFKAREEALYDELETLLDQPYTEDLETKILKITNQINKINSVRKIAFDVMRKKKSKETDGTDSGEGKA